MFTSIAGSRAPGAGSDGAARRAARDCAVETWYHALEQETAAVGAERWTLHVMGIHAARGKLWIQIQPSPESAVSLVLKVGRTTRVEDALAALRMVEWADGRPVVIDATRPSIRVERVARPRPLRRPLPTGR